MIRHATDSEVVTAEALRRKQVPNEPFPVRMRVVCDFLNIRDPDYRDIATGVVLDDLHNQGAG